MRAVRFFEPTGSDALRVEEAPDPVVGRNEVIVAVEAVTINPVDHLVVSGGAADRMPSGPPWTPGWDLAGVITDVGHDVDPELRGQRVLGFSQWFQSGRGTHASLVALPVGGIAAASGMLSPSELTTFGLNGLTALHALHTADVPERGTVLVAGATGAVGTFVVELAEHRGFTVIPVLRETDRASLRLLRADALVNCAPLDPSVLAGVRDGGTAISVTRPFESERGIRSQRVAVRPDAEGLREIVRLAEQGVLGVRVRRTLPVDQVREAYRDDAASASHGRTVLTF